METNVDSFKLNERVYLILLKYNKCAMQCVNRKKVFILNPRSSFHTQEISTQFIGFLSMNAMHVIQNRTFCLNLLVL